MRQWVMLVPMSRSAWEDESFRKAFREQAEQWYGKPEGFVFVSEELIEGPAYLEDGEMITVTAARFVYEGPDDEAS